MPSPVTRQNTGGLIPTVASAAALAIPGGVDTIKVSGVTAITSMLSTPGRRITLIFLAACTLTNGATIKLAGAVNFVATADDAITLVYDGTAWREVARSVN